MTRNADLLAILTIGHATSMRGDGFSLREALSRARYNELRPGFAPLDLLRVVRTHPELVEEWLAYSEDKRTDGGWYVLRSGEIGRVTVPGSRAHFGSVEEAVAEYVIRELDFWATDPTARAV